MEVREANLEDASDILLWRNDEVTRSMSFQTNMISSQETHSWLKSALISPARHLFIGLFEKNKIGICRFDFDDNFETVEVSININPSFRGKGLSKKLLNSSIKIFKKEHNKPIIARIKNENLASIHLFETCNFVLYSKNKNDLTYLLSTKI